jgi:membrane protease YdiL (CAAX protease family)
MEPRPPAYAGPAMPFEVPAEPSQGGQARPYPQLLRGPRFVWWRPFLSLVVLAGAVCVVLSMVFVADVAYLSISQATGRSTAGGPSPPNWEATPAGMLATNLVLAALVPATMAAVWVGFGWKPRWAASVVGGIRWCWLGWCAGVAVAVLVLPMLVITLLTEDVSSWTPQPQWPALAAVVILTTPLQAAGEEYLFRGWIPLTIGSLFGAPRVGGLVGGTVASLLFAFAHGQQDPWLFIDRFAFGAIACWLVWRTGGLEAGIAVHAVNNLSVFGFTLAKGNLVRSLSPTHAILSGVVVDVVTLTVAGVVISALARRQRVTRLFVPSVPAS